MNVAGWTERLMRDSCSSSCHRTPVFFVLFSHPIWSSPSTWQRQLHIPSHDHYTFFFLFQTSELSPISLQIQFNHLINPQKTNPPSPSFFNIKDQITPKSNSIIWEYPAFIFLIGPMKTELNKPPKTPPLCLICWCHISLAPSFPNFLFPSFLLFNLGNSAFTVANIIKSVLILHHPLPPLFHILCYCVRAVALSTFCLIMRRTVRWK